MLDKQPWIPKSAWTPDFRLIKKKAVPNWTCNHCVDADGEATSNWGDRACCYTCGKHPTQKIKDLQQASINATKRAQQQATSPTHRVPGAAGCSPWNNKPTVAETKGEKDKQDKPATTTTKAAEEDTEDGKKDKEVLNWLEQSLLHCPKGEEYAEERTKLEDKIKEVKKRMQERLPPDVQARKAKFRLDDARRKEKKHEEAAKQAEEALKVAQEAAEQAKAQLDRTRQLVADRLAECERLKPAEPEATGAVGAGSMAADDDDDEDIKQDMAEVARLQAKVADQRAAKAKAKANEAAVAAGEAASEAAEIEDEPMDDDGGDDPFAGDDEARSKVQAAMAQAIDDTMQPKEGESDEAFATRKRLAHKQRDKVGAKRGVTAKIGDKARANKQARKDA